MPKALKKILFILLIINFSFFVSNAILASGECSSCDSNMECDDGMTCADCRGTEVMKNCPGSGCSDASGRCVSTSTSASTSSEDSERTTYSIGSSSYSSSSGGWNLASLAYFGLPGGSIFWIVYGVLQWILALFGFLGIIGFAISGILYLLSAGDDDRMKSAKRAMQYSIIGVIVGLSGVIIMRTVYMLLT